MKKIANLVLISVLGGAITLSSYLFLIKDKNKAIQIVSKQEAPSIIHTSDTKNTNNNSKFNIDFTQAAKKTVDVVVHVKNTAIKTVIDPYAQLFYGRQNAERQFAQVGTGSGVIISPDGYIVTNNHVIRGATDLEITLNNKEKYKATIVGTDSKSDIALLKIDAANLPFITFGNSDTIKVGEWVLAVGNPYNLTSTVTAGIVSAKARDLAGNLKQDSFIQTDAAVNPGNSGGALVNTKGELIGINTAISSKTGAFVGYSFAVPSNIARKVVEDLLEYGSVQHAILGVNGAELNGTSAKELNIDTSEGFYVSEVIKNSGADKGGLQKNDVIVKIDEMPITSFSDLNGYIGTKEPNDLVKVTVLRNNDYLTLEVKLNKKELYFVKNLNFNLKDLTQSELNNYGISSGAKIVSVDNEALKNYGVANGYIITNINNIPIENAEQAQKILNMKQPNQAFRIEMLNPNGELERYIFR
ncbi:MAG TPA: PDZ domain-containing protein [Flavobacteriia bacterium]|nr:PDZ domain-containing protein [Flavobacteriia bacterium]